MSTRSGLVIGGGSAGRRHAENLNDLGLDVLMVSHQKDLAFPSFSSLEEALKSGPKYDVAVICSPTCMHEPHFETLYPLSIPTLVEKPFCDSLQSARKWEECVDSNHRVAYLLRYHPVVKEVIRLLPKCGEVFLASFRFGQYLPFWRPGRDYRDTYSAKKELGGGVILDSSHEIDLITYLLGKPKKIFGTARKISPLEISSEDYGAARFEMKNGALVDLNLNYIQRIPERVLTIDGETGGIYANLLTGEVSFQNNGEISRLEVDIDRGAIFREELRSFLFSRAECVLPTVSEACEVVKIAEAIKYGVNGEKR